MNYAAQVAKLAHQYIPKPTHGWRLWVQSPTTGGVVSFISLLHGLATDLDQTTPMQPHLVAHCPHGNVPPSPRCSCGVHFVEDFHALQSNVRTYYIEEAELGAIKIDRSLMVATFGVATGPVIQDRNPDESWGGQRPWRSSGYRMLGMLVEPQNTEWRRLAQIYRLPVRTRGINAKQARIIESKVRQ